MIISVNPVATIAAGKGMYLSAQ